MDERWSEAEFAAAVDAYLGLLTAVDSGEEINLTAVRRSLHAGPLQGRTEGAIEFRMQNISAVRELRGERWLPNYKPARNVGARGIQIISDLLDARMDALPPTRPPERLQRVFVTGMWGFNPEAEGYVGFTRETTRTRLLRDHQPGDLMLIVGQKGEFSLPGEVGRLLGLVELEPRAIFEEERMAAAHYAEKVRKFGPDRWRFALPIKKAWRIRAGVKATNIIGQTYSQKTAQFIGANFAELTEAEVAAIMGLPGSPTAVWGEPEWTAEVEANPAETHVSNAVSRGPAPSFGTRSVTVTDGDNFLYLMLLQGPVDAVFPALKPTQHARTVIKVGRSNDPKRRCVEMNCSFPPGTELRWALSRTQKFSSADEAHDAEQSLLTDLHGRGYSLGMEFACVPTKDVSTLLARVAGKSAYTIRSVA